MREVKFLLLLPPASAVEAGCAYGARHPIANLVKRRAEVRWCDAGHALNDVRAYRDRAARLGEHAGLGPVEW